jgi:4-coumarate--CoA ligase
LVKKSEYSKSTYLRIAESKYGVAQEHAPLHLDARNPREHLTKWQLRTLVRRIAHTLRTKFGVGTRGSGLDVVTVISYGQILVPAVFLGVIAAGGVYSAASPSSTASDLERQLRTSNSRLVICDVDHAQVVTDAFDGCNIPREHIIVTDPQSSKVFRALEGTKELLSSASLDWERVTDASALRRSLAVILWSSGTTGVPKGMGPVGLIT